MSEQKIEQFWRDAIPVDIAKVMKGEKVEARFRDFGTATWSTDRFLAGYDALSTTGMHWIESNANQWKFCQVYDPPRWYIDKPDPGEGWRLLEKFPDEPKLATDDAWDCHLREWRQTFYGDGIQCEEVWYRRRIEPVKHDAGSTCASTIPKGWIKLQDDEPRLESDAFWSVGAKDWVIIDECRVEYANRDKWPAIRQIETHKSMMLMEGCFYRLPNGHSIKVTKQGFEVF